MSDDRDDDGKSKDAKAQPPWLALALALLAITAPFTTAIHGWLATSRELALTTAKQEHEIRLAYLDRAIDPNRTPADRQIVLRFLVAATAASDPIRAWAQAELGAVNSDIDRLTKQRDLARQRLQTGNARAQALESELAKVQASDPAKARALTSDLASARQQAQRAASDTSALNAAIGKPEPLAEPVPQ